SAGAALSHAHVGVRACCPHPAAGAGGAATVLADAQGAGEQSGETQDRGPADGIRDGCVMTVSAKAMQPIYLTFDDGPDPDFTPQVLLLLQVFDMRATFFMVGQQAQRFPALAREVAAGGHVIGNHTFSHRHPWSMLPARARREVSAGAETLRDILGSDVQFYRPPHGRHRKCMER